MKSVWGQEKSTIAEKRKKVREYHDNFLPEKTPTKTKTGLISIPKKRNIKKYTYVNLYMGFIAQEIGNEVSRLIGGYIGNKFKNKKLVKNLDHWLEK